VHRRYIWPVPFKTFKVKAALRDGVNTLRVVVGNTKNSNWHWNGFSMVIENNLRGYNIAFLS
jgi:hypothetical protein